MARHLTVLQPTPFCNINCSYCHLPHRNVGYVMSYDTLRAAFRFVLRGNLNFSEYTFLWHAGEPTTAGIEFYQKATSILNEEVLPGQRVKQTMQTNGTLINEKWIKFFKTANFQVGVSIDGPQFISDRHRIQRNGVGTYQQAIRGLRMLLAANVPTSVISVLTPAAMDYAEDFFEWCVEEGIRYIAFNPEETEGINKSKLYEDGMDLRYARFLLDFLSRSLTSDHQIEVREFSSLRDGILGYSSGDRVNNHQVEPWAIVNIDCHGNVSSFSPELIGHKNVEFEDFIFGNVNNSDLSTCREAENFKRLHSAILDGIRKCASTCQYFSFCGGGAPSNKYFERGSFAVGETLGCRFGQQIPLEVALILLGSDKFRKAAPPRG